VSVQIESLVQSARQLLVEDDGRLWNRTALPQWILAESDVWWLTEAVDGAEPFGELWQVPPEPTMGVGSTSVRWRERSWAMVDCISTPPTVRLLLHEAFHAFWQPGAWDWVKPADGGDDTLALPESRAALRVELRAWAQALTSEDQDDLSAAQAVRKWRLDQLDSEELRRQDYLDLWEGLPEYSAWNWTNASTAEVAALAATGPQASSWHRSFCYTTGPVLGWALDRLRPGWREDLPEAGSLTRLLDQVPGLQAGAPDGVLNRLGYSQVLSSELEEHQERARADGVLRARFSTVLWVPLRGSIQFDPREVRHWDLGTFYKTLSVQTDGLHLKASKGAVVTTDWKWVGLPDPIPAAANADVFKGPGWSLTIIDRNMATHISCAPTPPAE